MQYYFHFDEVWLYMSMCLEIEINTSICYTVAAKDNTPQSKKSIQCTDILTSNDVNVLSKSNYL